ncbi:MAG: DNA repair protein RadC [Eubacteriales bacterium]|nr:DNA repair protein RadC [Eubacteriales bacterium]
MQKTIKELPPAQRPYEKCLREGTGALSDSELLAVILKNGTKGSSSIDLANEILSTTEESPYPGLLGLMHVTLKDLMKIKGIGQVKAIQLKCIGELSKRIATSAARLQLCFGQPETVAQYYMEQLRHEGQEFMVCMMLDSSMHLLGEQLLSKGTVNAALITPREVFLEALRFGAVNLILIHNHPSGNPAPSEEDIMITERIYRTGEMLGIHLADHIIIGDHRYISFTEQGILKRYNN